MTFMILFRSALVASPAACAAFWLVVTFLAGIAASASETDSEAASRPSADSPNETTREEVWLLPNGELFEPLLADPQWPRFSAEYQWRLGSDQFDRVGQVSFGESIAMVRSRQYAWGEWEFGLHANVDAVFDLTQKSFDLSNEDYVFGLTWAVLTRGVTTQFRVYHLSSHVGDEYLLENGGGRDNVSVEAIDVLLSFEPTEWMRLYGGIGGLVNPSPAFDPVITEFGIEVVGPKTFASGKLTPIAAMDIQVRQQNDWIPDIAIVAGFRIAQPGDDVRRIEFVARYYNGRSPDGQFFREKIESLGLGFRLGF
jgi:hypothetical protein